MKSVAGNDGIRDNDRRSRMRSNVVIGNCRVGSIDLDLPLVGSRFSFPGDVNRILLAIYQYKIIRFDTGRIFELDIIHHHITTHRQVTQTGRERDVVIYQIIILQLQTHLLHRSIRSIANRIKRDEGIGIINVTHRTDIQNRSRIGVIRAGVKAEQHIAQVTFYRRHDNYGTMGGAGRIKLQRLTFRRTRTGIDLRIVDTQEVFRLPASKLRSSCVIVFKSLFIRELEIRAGRLKRNLSPPCLRAVTDGTDIEEVASLRNQVLEPEHRCLIVIPRHRIRYYHLAQSRDRCERHLFLCCRKRCTGDSHLPCVSIRWIPSCGNGIRLYIQQDIRRRHAIRQLLYHQLIDIIDGILTHVHHIVPNDSNHAVIRTGVVLEVSIA